LAGAPALGPVTSNYTFNIVSTTNSSDPDASAEPGPARHVQPPLVPDRQHDLQRQADGFEDTVGDGFLTSDDAALHVREGGTASADLFAEVTPQTAAVAA